MTGQIRDSEEKRTKARDADGKQVRILEKRPNWSAKDENARWRLELADDAPTMAEAIFAIARVICDRLGPQHCPFHNHTRCGECVALRSPCVMDERQPKSGVAIQEENLFLDSEATMADVVRTAAEEGEE